MTMYAKFASTCPKCQQPIALNERIDWVRGQKATHVICPAAPVHAVNVTPAATIPTATIGGIANVVALLSKVSVANGGTLKAPKMRFLGPDGKSELRLSLAKATGTNPGAVYVKLDNFYMGKIAPNGSTVIKDAALLTTLTNIGMDPAAAAKAYGAFAGRCSFCGKELTDAGSVEVGYGPICAGQYGLPHTPKGTPAVKMVPVVKTPREAVIELADEQGLNTKHLKPVVAPTDTEQDAIRILSDAVRASFDAAVKSAKPVTPKPVEVAYGVRIVDVE